MNHIYIPRHNGQLTHTNLSQEQEKYIYYKRKFAGAKPASGVTCNRLRVT